MDGVIGIRTGAGSVELRLAGEGSIRLKEALIIPQGIGLSRSFDQSIDHPTATPSLAIAITLRGKSPFHQLQAVWGASQKPRKGSEIVCQSVPIRRNSVSNR
jgi:hypothetical protein